MAKYSPEELSRLDARMAELDKYLKDPSMKLGKGASGKLQFSKADSETRAVKMTPKMTATSASSATKTAAPTGYDEDTRAALQQLGPRRGVTTESITKPSDKDAAKIAAYKADQERQARNVSRGREAMMTAGSMLPLGMGAAAARGAAAAGRSAAAKEAADAVASKLPWREDYLGRLASEAKKAAGQAAERGKTFGPNSVPDWMKKAMADQAAAEKAAAFSKTFGPGSVPEWMRGAASGMKKGGAVKPGKVKTVMHEFKTGKLKSSSGQKVTNPKQAIAIAMSEAGMKKAKKFGGGGTSKLDPEIENDLRNQEELRKAREEERQQKQKAAPPKAYAKGGKVGESKAMAKKEISFMKRKGAPKSMIKHEKEEYGMKKGGACMAGGGMTRMVRGMTGSDAAPKGKLPPRYIPHIPPGRPLTTKVTAMADGGMARRGGPQGLTLQQPSMGAKIPPRPASVKSQKPRGMSGRPMGMKSGGGIDGIAKKGKTKTQHFAKGGSVSARADGIASKGKTSCKIC